jgi:hypothetical protein
MEGGRRHHPAPIRETAFGKLVRGPDPELPPSEPELPTLDVHLVDLVASDIGAEVENYLLQIPLFASGIHSHLPSGAVPLIFSAATTDALAVVRHSNELDGRSAALRARTLFEHLINLYDVCDSATNTGRRYMDHKWAVQHLASTRRDHLQVLRPADKRREGKRLDALAKSSHRPLQRALAKYGPRFRAGWAEGSVKDRAKAHGFFTEYDGYALLSAAIHGSSGSLTGVVRRIDNQVVHRTGHDLELAGLAWWEGISFYYMLMRRINQDFSCWESQQVLQATANLLWAWPREKIPRKPRQEDLAAIGATKTHRSNSGVS